MVHNPMVVKKMNEVVAHLNESLINLEKVKKIHLLPEEWSPESGELTPTLKNKRAVIEKKFAREIGDMFG
jgi:long-chain acyl-CoA synthetase